LHSVNKHVSIAIFISQNRVQQKKSVAGVSFILYFKIIIQQQTATTTAVSGNDHIFFMTPYCSSRDVHRARIPPIHCTAYNFDNDY